MAFEHLAGISLSMSAAVKVLPNSPKISHLTKRNVFELNFS